ncbi:acyl-coenzyme A diphosphatase NUDT19 [Drosophila tropicalis]|uniref:acyl-coenzyme A diphosphatase NUDT19 n=1 Tax=Drosophila tropicalis TaxID=46794 RepID=UPI0035ABA5FF
MVAPVAKKDIYRPSASLILAARDDSRKAYDFNLLLIKRSERTSYTLNHCVFPGGGFDVKSDESSDWLNYFQSFGIHQDHLDQLRCKDQVSGRPNLMTDGKNFSRDISLRITALREAFEEVGILLCRQRGNLWHGSPSLVHPAEHSEWQQKVHNDASQFLELCRHLDVIPDLWTLHEWSIWRSGATSSRKFDTVYYITVLEQPASQVELLLEPQEVISAHWLNPSEAWSSYQKEIIWLPFILMYEIGKLMNFHQAKDLFDFASKRNALGSTLIQPIFYSCDDGMLGVFAGDDLYLPDPHKYTKSIILKGSLRDYNRQAKHYNRMIFQDFHQVKLASNVAPLDGHLPLQSQVNYQLAKL